MEALLLRSFHQGGPGIPCPGSSRWHSARRGGLRSLRYQRCRSKRRRVGSRSSRWPALAAKESIQQAIDAGWGASRDEVNTVQQALNEMDVDSDVHREGDHIIIVFRRREDEDDERRGNPAWK